MVDTRIPVDTYPFATKDGRVIPLDILRSKGLIYQAFNKNTSNEINIPLKAEVAIVYATQDCLLFLNENELAPVVINSITLLPNTIMPSALIIPKTHAICVVVTEGIARVIGLGLNPGFIYVQIIEKWAGLDLPINYTNR